MTHLINLNISTSVDKMIVPWLLYERTTRQRKPIYLRRVCADSG